MFQQRNFGDELGLTSTNNYTRGKDDLVLDLCSWNKLLSKRKVDSNEIVVSMSYGPNSYLKGILRLKDYHILYHFIYYSHSSIFLVVGC